MDIALLRYRAYRLEDGQVVVSFNQMYPVPSVEEFTIGRRPDTPTAATVEHGPPWDRDSLARLATQANKATVALLDLCAAEETGAVGVKDIAAQAGLSVNQVRAQLAGLTMRLKNPNYGFAQNVWPATVTWMPGGFASYRLDPLLAETWRDVRSAQPDS